MLGGIFKIFGGDLLASVIGKVVEKVFNMADNILNNIFNKGQNSFDNLMKPKEQEDVNFEKEMNKRAEQRQQESEQLASALKEAGSREAVTLIGSAADDGKAVDLDQFSIESSGAKDGTTDHDENVLNKASYDYGNKVAEEAEQKYLQKGYSPEDAKQMARADGDLAREEMELKLSGEVTDFDKQEVIDATASKAEAQARHEAKQMGMSEGDAAQFAEGVKALAEEAAEAKVTGEKMSLEDQANVVKGLSNIHDAAMSHVPNEIVKGVVANIGSSAA